MQGSNVLVPRCEKKNPMFGTIFLKEVMFERGGSFPVGKASGK